MNNRKYGINHTSGRAAHDSTMKQLFGLGERAKWPAAGIPSRRIQGVICWVNPLLAADERKTFIRVRCMCPGCGREMAASRLHQHVCKAGL